MLQNHFYNLMAQLVEESKSLQRIKALYRRDAKGCKHCTSFWGKMLKDKEDHVAEITKLLKGHMK